MGERPSLSLGWLTFCHTTGPAEACRGALRPGPSASGEQFGLLRPTEAENWGIGFG